MGGVHAGVHKVVGSVGGYMDYLREQTAGFEKGAGRSIGYYARSKDEIAFEHVSGRAASFLGGLDLDRGLTLEQAERLWAGQWDAENKIDPGYRRVWETDDHGNEIKLVDPETGKWVGVPVIDPATGRQKMQQTHIAGYDCPFSFDKSVDELVIAHPELREAVESILVRAANKGMEIGVEDSLRIVKRTVKTPSEVGERTTKTQGSASELVCAEGCVWLSIPQWGSRPTPESVERGYDADPHAHVHCFLSSMVQIDGRWKAIDGDQLFKRATFRAEVASVEAARLLEEELGIEIDYSEPNRKGEISWHIKGSSDQVRKFLSTNAERAWKIRMAYEATHGKAMTGQELQQAMQRSKGRKTKGSKEADLGGEEYFAKVRKALEDHDLELTIEAAGGSAIVRHDLAERLAVLYDRLEAPEGLTRDCDTESVFGADVIYPAAFRAAMGLGFSADQVRTIADWYVAQRLVLVRDAQDDRNKLWTTETVRRSEQENAEWFELLAAKRGESVSGYVVPAMLDDGQRAAVEAICSHRRLVMIVGRAGAGKTTTLKTAVDVLRDGHAVGCVVSTAVAAKRALETGQTIGADVSGSIVSIERQVATRSWVPSSRDVVFVDEASMLSSLDLARLRKAIGDKPKVVMIGDPKQLQAIGPAGWLNQELGKREVVELVRVYRQKEAADRDAFDLIRDGNAHVALAELAERGRFHVEERDADLVGKVLERVRLHRDSGRSAGEVAVVHQGSNIDLDTLNRFIQRDRIHRGELAVEARFKVEDASTGRRWTLFKGDRIVFNRGVFAELDAPIRNGSTGEVIRMTPDGRCRVRLDGDERRTVTVQLDARAEVQPIVPGYAMSSAKFQGAEAKVVIVCPGSPETASLNSGYSQVTRSVEHVDICLSKETWGNDPARALGRAWSVEQTKHLASELLAEVEAEEIDLDGRELEREVSDGDSDRLAEDLRREIDERERDTGWELGF